MEHKAGKGGGFTSKYKIIQLVYYECSEDIIAAIEREKQIKGGSRQKKVDLVNEINPNWHDLFDDLFIQTLTEGRDCFAGSQ